MSAIVDYLKDNPQGYWFKRKLYGWGWVPVRWQGWATLAVFIAYATWLGIRFADQADSGTVSGEQTVLFLTKIALAVALLLYVCYQKGEKPKWQWGIPKD